MSAPPAVTARIRPFQAIRAALSERGSQGRIWLAGLLGVLAVAAVAAVIGTVRTFYYGHDIFVVLAAGWRFVQGQVPHVDYASWWGPVPSIVFGAGLILRRNTVGGIGCGLAIAAL